MLTFTTRELEEIWIALIDKCEKVLKQAAEFESLAERLESGEPDPSLDPGSIGPEAMRQTARDFRAWESSIGRLSSKVRAEMRQRDNAYEGANMSDFKRGDIVTVEDLEGEWRVTHVRTHSAELIAAGLGPKSYTLENTKTGHALHTNQITAPATH